LTTEAATQGALARQLQPRVHVMAQASPAAEAPAAPNLSGAVQATLFHDRSSNVIPIASYAPPRLEPRSRAGVESTAKPPVHKPATRRAKPVPEGQGTLDFLPQATAKPRQLGTTVEAVIYCEAPVATTLHRAVAVGLDWGMVLLGYALFLAAFSMMGGEFTLTKANLGVSVRCSW